MTTESSINIIHTLSGKQENDLLVLYRNEFWCNTRQPPDIRKMLANTDIIIGAENETKKLIGFVRVLTDYVYKATVYDLIVHPAYRGQGLGAQLMERVINHPNLSAVGTIDLNCLPGMNGFYERWQFSTDLGELSFMRRFHSKVKKNAE